MPAHPYFIPAAQVRQEIQISNSRFIATLAPVFSVDEARQFIHAVRAEFSDATHNVPAYLVGHGASEIAHCSDDGEPSGTAGRPALAVLRGSGLGDVAVVITRYFGGTKLGTGGLVRAYSDSVRAVLAVVRKAQRLPVHTALLALPYPYLERLRLLVPAHSGEILDETFAGDVTLTLRFPTTAFAGFQAALSELTNGRLAAELIETGEVIMPVDSLA